MKQPMLAPAAFGGSIIAGVAAMLVSGYRIVDCMQFRSERGACDQVIEQNALPLVAGVAAIAGSFGGFYTYNENLHMPGARRRRDDGPVPELHFEPEPKPLPLPDPVAALVDDPDQQTPAPVHGLRDALAELLLAQGMTQQEMADALGVSRSTVQRLLQQ